MSKRRDPSPPKPVRPEMPAEHPPGREDVERAIENVLDRLLPKPRRPSTKPRADQSKPGPVRHLALVPDTGGDRD